MRCSVLSFSVGWAAVACCSLSAICAMPTPSYGEGPQAQQSNPGQEDPDYNGEDLTRPQRSSTAASPMPNSWSEPVGPNVQAILSHAIDQYWAFGFGARLVAPMAEDSLGTGKWQIMPGFGVRDSLPEIGPDTYFVPAVRYAISFAGDPTRRNINEPQIAPTLNIGLLHYWFVTFYPSYDIRINYGDPFSGTNRTSFPPV